MGVFDRLRREERILPVRQESGRWTFVREWLIPFFCLLVVWGSLSLPLLPVSEGALLETSLRALALLAFVYLGGYTLKEKGIIRRIGGNFRPEKVGFFSTLCAARVPEDKLDAFAECVNRFTGVTHNYVRDHRFNVWFTFIAPSVAAIEQALKDIEQATGVTDILNLPATRVFKISAQFTV